MAGKEVDETPDFIELAMEQAAVAMATMKNGEVVQPGVHHEGRYYFSISSSKDLFVVRWQAGKTPPVDPNRLVGGFDREDFFSENIVSPDYRGDRLLVHTTYQMPAAVVVMMMRGVPNG